MTQRRSGTWRAVMAGAALAVAIDSGDVAAQVGRDAFARPVATLSDRERAVFRNGESLFHQAWLVAPSREQPDLDGLGPLHNRLSCIACHIGNGRGEPPRGAPDVMRSMVVRLSIPGRNEHGGPQPHPAYGDQLNPDGIPGVPGEGKAILVWHEFVEILADGTRVPMRRPELRFRDLAYGPLDDDVLTSVRIAPPVFGMGLLEAVPEAAIVRLAATQSSGADGIRGRVNRVWDTVAGTHVVGRFGWKANQAGLRQQVAAAFRDDLGITSSMRPNENCADAQAACRAAASGGRPELSDGQLDAVMLYLRSLAPPQRRGIDHPRVRQGEALFATIGCARCHVPTLPVAAGNGVAGATQIHPYTDLLLHDMGDGLADGRPDFAAGPRDWRTPPLWGLGLTAIVGDQASYLHDGRARTVIEAILWHGGEAQASADSFRALTAIERDALLAFLNTL
ncbi:di-heme oxidoredictase family protein [Reyranella sp. CPCC 100927]|uniref:di-heme oxidoreductase family protein n=1 Tax=Reyranella sp. CPCC 100927 TaxID=2599616 RepID=UPI00210713F2|nr:di-heme oxidoredictase family protein [Reyranella sp. CPCC 100927]